MRGKGSESFFIEQKNDVFFADLGSFNSKMCCSAKKYGAKMRGMPNNFIKFVCY
jgi:hypothetical protein